MVIEVEILSGIESNRISLLAQTIDRDANTHLAKTAAIIAIHAHLGWKVEGDA